ncbi:O-antigen ligase family protein [Candidatus Pelagibacter sp.]|nr:O-antigen ligase family protein [Candidatus Pelagibacter sp.]
MNSIEKNFFTISFSIFPILLIAGTFLSNFYLTFISVYFFYFCIKKNHIVWKKNYLVYSFSAFYIYLLLNSIFADDILISLKRTLPYIRFFIFVLFFKILIENNFINLKKILFFWLIILVIISLDMFYQGITGYNITGYSTGHPLRNSSFFFDELKVASFFVGFSFLSVSYFLEKKYYYKTLVLLIIFLIACLISGERSNLIRYVLIFSFTFFLIIKSINFKKKIFILFILFIPITGALYLNGDKIYERFFVDSISYNNEQDLQSIYKNSRYGAHAMTSLEILKDNFFIGVGNKNFRKVCKNYQKKLINDGFINGCSTHPHQTYYEFLSEHGVIGTLIIMSIIFGIIIKKIKEDNLSMMNLMALMFILNIFIPILPTGSFFTSYSSTIFWMNMLFFLINSKNKKIL